MVNRLFHEYLKNKKKKRVVTNFWTSFSESLNPENMLNFELKNCILGITETYGLLDSSNRGKASEYLSYFIFQSGKNDVDMYYDTQLENTVDLRLRHLAVKRTECRNEGTRERPDFHYAGYDSSMRYFYEFRIPYEIAQPYFKLYHTKEIVMPLYVSSKSLMNIDEIIEMHQEAGNKKTFTVLLREKNPYLTWEKAGAVYTLVEDGKLDKVKKLLRL